MKKYYIFLLFAVLIASQGYSQFEEYPNEVLFNWAHPYKSYTFQGQHFRIKYPNNYDSLNGTKKYPVILFFHGFGERGTDNENQLKHGGQRTLNAINSGEFPGMAVYPQTTGVSWDGGNLTSVVNLLDELIAKNHADPDRIYVHGLSLGAEGVWRFAFQYPQYAAAIFPMSGVVGGNTAGVTRFIPTWLSQGGRDRNPTPVTGNSRVTSWRNQGANIRYSYMPTTGHGTWNAQYSKSEFFPWFLEKHKTDITVLYGQSSFCEGDPINITLGVTAGFANYQWVKNDTTSTNFIATGSGSNTINVTSTGNYYVRFQRANGVWTKWSKPVDVNRDLEGAVQPSVSVENQSLNLPTLAGQQTVEILGPQGLDFYRWFRNDVIISGANSSSYTTSAEGEYAVSVRTAQELGFQDEAETIPSEFQAPPQPCFSEPSDPLIVTTENGLNVPAKPTNFSANILNDNSIVINWDDNSSDELAFELYRSVQSGTGYALIQRLPSTNGSNPQSFIDTPLDANTTYYYRMRAVNNSGGSDYTGEVSASTLVDSDAPSAPVLNLIGSTTNSVSIEWTASTDNIGVVSYDIFRNNALVASLSSEQFQYTNTGLAINQTYSYVVKAKDATGNISLPSNQVTAKTSVSQGLNYTYYHHGNFSSVDQIESNATVIKTGIVNNFDISVRERSDRFAFIFEGLVEIPTAGEYTFFTNSDDGSKLYINNQLIVDNDGTHGCQQRSGTVNLPAGLAAIRVPMFENGGGQCLEVRWQGPGISKQYIPDNRLFNNSFELSGFPAQPSGLQATVISNKQIDLSWVDNSNNEDNFEIYRSLNQNLGYQLVHLAAANAVSWSDTNLSGGTTYYYKIKAINLNGSSAFTTPVPATTAANPAAPAAPGNLSLEVENSSSVRLNWSDNATTEVGFEIYRSTSSVESTFTLIHTTASDIMTYLDEQTEGNSTYYYRIRAKGDGNFSGFTPTLNITTDNNPPVIESIIDRSVKYGNTLELPIIANDPDGDPITFSFTNGLPTFMSFTDNGYGSGQLTIVSDLINADVYTVEVIADDGSGGTDSESFLVTISNNENPVVTPISNIVMKEGFTNSFVVIVGDETPSSLVLSASNEPAFVSFVDNGNGSGTFTISPEINQSGIFNNIKLLAGDGNGGFSEVSFNLVVESVNRNYSVFVNYGSNAPSPWTNIPAGFGAKQEIPLLSNDGVTNEIIHFVGGGWYQNNETSTLSSQLFPVEVVQSYLRKFNGGGANFELRNLNPGLSYDLSFYAGSNILQASNFTAININGTSRNINFYNNTSDTVTFKKIKPNSQGVLQVAVSGGTTFILNGMVVDVYYEDGLPPAAPSNLALTAVSNSEIELTWNDNSNNEQRFEIDRSEVSETGPFENVASVAANQGSYTDENLSGNTTYYYKVRAVNSTGTAESSVAFITTQNSAPALATIQNVTMSVGETLSIPLTATDAEGDDIILNGASLPGFVELVDNADGTGVLNLNPAANDAGFYGNNIVEATDIFGLSSEVSFNIQVVDNDFANTVYLNFGDNANASSPWNNIDGSFAQGTTYNSIEDFDGVASNISLEIGSGWSIAAADGMSSGSNSFIFEDEVFQNYWRSNNTSASLKLTGLDNAKLYTIELLSSSNEWLNTETNFTVQNKNRDNINVTKNEDNILSFSGIQPNPSGEIDIVLDRFDALTEAMFINALVVRENIPGEAPLEPSDFMVKGISKTEIELRWQDNSVNETGYEIYVTDEIGKTFTLLNTVSSDSEYYLHNGLVPNTAMIYKVRAISANSTSEFTAEKAAVTINNKILININTDISDYLQAAAPWNNTNRVPTTGLVFDNLIDMESNAVGVELSIEDIGDGSNNKNGFTSEGLVYPAAVMQAYYYFEPNAAPGLFRLSNLSDDMAYDLTFMGSHGGALFAITDYTVGEKTVTGFGKSNRYRTSTIHDVFPDDNSTILFEVDASNENAAQYGLFNSLVIEEHLSADVALDRIAPSVPQNLVANNITENSLDLLWNTATDNVSLSGYEVYQNGALIATTKEATLSVTGLVPDYEYLYTVRSVDRNGNKSAFSNDLIINTAPAAGGLITYYYEPSGGLNDVNSWNSEENGSGTAPTDFTSENHLFILNSNATLGSDWTISGAGSRLQVSNDVILTLDANFTGTISALSNASVDINVDTSPEFIEMHPSSTVSFNSANSAIPAAKYGNLNLGSTGSTKQFEAGNVTIEGTLNVSDGVAMNGVDPNGTTIVAKGSVSFHGIGASAQTGQMLSLVMAGTGSQQIETFSENINLYALQVRDGADVVFNTESPNLQVSVGNAAGGGIIIEDGASLDIGAHNLVVNGRGVINPENQTGKIKSNNGNLEIHSTSTLTSHLYFEPGGDTLNSLVADMVNLGKVEINSPLHISEELEVIDGIVDVRGNLTMVSTAAGTAYISEIQNRGEIQGAIKAQRYVAPPASKLYRYYGSMVKNATVADWQEHIAITGAFTGSSTGSGLGSSPSVFYYDETQTAKWMAYPTVSNQEVMEPGKGFAVYMRDLNNPLTLELSGEAVQGDFDFSLTPGTGDPLANGGLGDGWNLVANPYQSPIQWGATGWTSQGLGPIVSVWDADYPGGGKFYYAGVGVNESLFDGEIAIGQGFWVQAIEANPQLRITESAKVKQNNTSFYRNSASQSPVVVVSLTKDNLEDKAFIKFSAEGSEMYNPYVHGRKRANGIFNIASATKDGVDLAINQLPEVFCQDSVSLVTSNMSTGNYSLSFEQLESFQDGELFSLVDHYSNTEIRITPETNYDFEVVNSTGPSAIDRFTVVVKKPEIAQDLYLTQSSSTVCEGENQVAVTLEGSQKNVIYNLMLNGSYQNNQVVGTGNDISLTINAEDLDFGENIIGFEAGFTNCKVVKLDNSIVIDRLKLPNVNAVLPVTICKGSSTVITVEPTEDDLSFRWYANESDNHPILESASSTFETPLLDSSTTYFYAAVNSNGCESKVREAVKVLVDSLDMSIELFSSASDVCVNDEYSIVGLSGSQLGVTYSVLVKGEILAEELGTGTNISFQVANSELSNGENVIRVKAQSTICSSMEFDDSLVINLNSPPVLETVEPMNICAGEPAWIVVDNKQEDLIYRWYLSETAQNPIYESDTSAYETEILYDTTTYFYSAVNSSGCESVERKAVIVNVDGIDKPFITSKDGLLESSSQSGNQWYFNEDPIEGETGSTLLASAMGAYSVSVTNGFCEVFSDVYEYQISSNAEQESFSLMIYPNPASTEINIALSQLLDESVNIKIVDLTGREVHSSTLQEGKSEYSLNIDDLASGTYTIQIIHHKRTFAKRLMVK
ncbi:Por secretion system C-terminal sorting domain-containing protein [Marivirga sericea]|uniref:Por secretion system C-terminal sorting domain-containing protein n=1 Tax=Marivirga sericea TaxID=1028 RepID=A0A1X7KKT0_9BACT|nr:fibronectin type III domain-containing protein [Marivirga sericea]SMG41898.1 Por secretion system C-terminal sorting domain-containing protein [Marivirga sericea]